MDATITVSKALCTQGPGHTERKWDDWTDGGRKTKQWLR